MIGVNAPKRRQGEHEHLLISCIEVRRMRHMDDSSRPTEHASRLVWFSWLLGSAMLGALVVGVLQLSDAGHFERVLQQAEPGWLLVRSSCRA